MNCMSAAARLKNPHKNNPEKITPKKYPTESKNNPEKTTQLRNNPEKWPLEKEFRNGFRIVKLV